MSFNSFSTSTSKAERIATTIAQQINPTFPGFDHLMASQLRDHFTPEQAAKVINLLKPYATTSFDRTTTREIFAIALNMGAHDLDVTPIIDEAERYQTSTDLEILEIIDDDQALLLEVITPSNFEQFNRYLHLDGPALIDNQVEFLRKAVRNKSFRNAPEFQWLATSRFATIPESAYAISFIGHTGPILWDSTEEEDLIDSLKASNISGESGRHHKPCA